MKLIYSLKIIKLRLKKKDENILKSRYIPSHLNLKVIYLYKTFCIHCITKQFNLPKDEIIKLYIIVTNAYILFVIFMIVPILSFIIL